MSLQPKRLPGAHAAAATRTAPHAVRLIAALLCVLHILVAPAFAVLGIGDIVFDPSNYAEAVQHLAQLELQYEQLVKTYQKVTNQYDQMITMAKQVPVAMEQRYHRLATPWSRPQATDTYGTSGAWTRAINGGQDTLQGYLDAIEKLNTYGSAFGNIPPGQEDHDKTDYSTVELTDGANVATLETLSQLRRNAEHTETVIRNLEADSYSSDPRMNSEIAVLNKINAASVLALHSAQDTNKLLVAMAEHQLIDSKRDRDAEASAINADIQFRANGRALLSAQGAGVSDAMRNWRMP